MLKTGPAVFRSTRDTRIRYDSKRVMRERAHDKQVQRGQAQRGRYVVGRFTLDADGVYLEAVAWQIGFWIDDRAPLTRSFTKFARWRTRQGARQWLLRHLDPRCQIVNLQQLRGREDVVTVTTPLVKSSLVTVTMRPREVQHA